MKNHRIPPRGWVLAILALSLGAAGGFLAGREWPDRRASGAETGDGLPSTGDRATPGGIRQGRLPSGGSAKGSAAATGTMIPLGASTGQTLRNILAIPDSLERLGTLRAWCLDLPPTEVIAVMEEFKQMMDAQERIGEIEAMSLFFQALDIVTGVLLEQGAGKAMDLLLSDPAGEEVNEMREGAGTAVFSKWAAEDLPAARAFLESRIKEGSKYSNIDEELAKGLMRAWVKTDPDAAMAWLLRQPEEISQPTVAPAFQALSHSNSDKALQLVEAQAGLPGRDEIAATIAGWWARTTPDKALDWAKGLPEQLAGPSVKEAVASWAGKDFAGAKQALEALSAPLQQAALPVLVERWEKGKWSEAAVFLDQQESGEGRQEAVSQLIRHWATGDQQAASAWLDRQAAGPERDAGAAALAEEVRGSDPEAAAIWGATLTDARQRQESLRHTLQSWYKKSVPEALQWLQTASGLTDSDRSALLGSVPAK